MTSKRALERRLDGLDPSSGDDGPDEIVITDYVVDSDWEPDDEDEQAGPASDESAPVSRLRCWRDDSGAWRSEREDLRDGVDGERCQ